MKIQILKKSIVVLTVFVLSIASYSSINDFISDDIVAAVRVDYKAISTDPIMSEFYKNGIVKNKIDSYEVFVSQTGFRPEKDLNSIYALFSKDVISGNSKRTAIIFNGVFNEKKVTNYFQNMKKENKKISYTPVKYIGKTFYKTPDGSCFVFFDKNNLVLGNLEFSKELLDRYEKRNLIKIGSTKDAQVKEDSFKKYFGRSSDKDHIKGLIKITEDTKANIKKKYPGQAVFAKIDDVSFHGKIVPGVFISIDLNADTADSAKNISDMLNNLKLAGTLYGARFGLLDIINGISVTSSAKAAVININLTYKQIKESVEKIKKIIPKSMIDKVKQQQNK